MPSHYLLLACLVTMPLLAEPDGVRQQQLLYLLQQDCGSCHGMQLKGGLGPALLPEDLLGKPDALLVNTILYGREGTAMPPWQPLLSEPEVQWLVERLRQGVAHEP